MDFHGSRIALGAALLSVAALLVAAAPASAGQEASSKGSDPGAAICKVDTAFSKAATKQGALEAKDIESGNWAGAKKIILADFKSESSELNKYQGVLNSLPANIKAAEEVEIKALPALVKSFEKINSLTEFESLGATLGLTPKAQAASKVVATYTTGICGTAL
jgi:hypothetical protein